MCSRLVGVARHGRKDSLHDNEHEHVVQGFLEAHKESSRELMGEYETVFVLCVSGFQWLFRGFVVSVY